MSKHTPWHVFSVYAQHEVRTPTDTLIAVVQSRDHARLIASAPAMLEALESMTAIVRYNADRIGYAKGSPLDKQIRAARAAIKAAKGE